MASDVSAETNAFTFGMLPRKESMCRALLAARYLQKKEVQFFQEIIVVVIVRIKGTAILVQLRCLVVIAAKHFVAEKQQSLSVRFAQPSVWGCGKQSFGLEKTQPTGKVGCLQYPI